MDVKRKVIAWLWIATACVFVGMAGLDSIDNGMLNWSYYLLLETSVVTIICSATIWFFTNECSICGKLVIRNDNYCKRCGTDLTRKTTLTSFEYEKVKSKSSQVSPLSESRHELRHLVSTLKARAEKEGEADR